MHNLDNIAKSNVEHQRNGYATAVEKLSESEDNENRGTELVPKTLNRDESIAWLSGWYQYMSERKVGLYDRSNRPCKKRGES